MAARSTLADKQRTPLAKPSAGYIAWLLWGGEPRKAWVDGLHDRPSAAAD